MSFNASPSQGLDKLGSFQNSPDLDYDYDFTGADSSFDYSMDNLDQPSLIGDLPGSSLNGRSESAETESPDKRSHPDDEEDETNGAKRRESEDKVAKKPGRKPLTTEPSSVSQTLYQWHKSKTRLLIRPDRSARLKIAPRNELFVSARRSISRI
jgi:AP-1-like transcription factor